MLVQPSEQVRRSGLDPRRLPAAARAAIKEDLFEKYLEMLEVNCQRNGDQLTRELLDFVQSVQCNRPPRVTGQDGLNALELADRVLAEVRNHSWTAQLDGPRGPSDLPPPLGSLIPQDEREAAA
jgi:hypothetical protein